MCRGLFPCMLVKGSRLTWAWSGDKCQNSVWITTWLLDFQIIWHKCSTQGVDMLRVLFGFVSQRPISLCWGGGVSWLILFLLLSCLTTFLSFISYPIHFHMNEQCLHKCREDTRVDSQAFDRRPIKCLDPYLNILFNRSSSNLLMYILASICNIRDTL